MSGEVVLLSLDRPFNKIQYLLGLISLRLSSSTRIKYIVHIVFKIIGCFFYNIAVLPVYVRVGILLTCMTALLAGWAYKSKKCKYAESIIKCYERKLKQ
jgi:hypothetical protein